mgnify:CR=1 FL=1
MNQMMDAIVKPTAGPGLELRQVPVPVPGPGEVLIKIHKTAICGSDVHIYKWNQWAQQHVKPPQVIGHEYVGEVAELGAGLKLEKADAASIRTAVDAVLQTPSYRASAQNIRESFLRCGGAKAAVDKILSVADRK